MANTYTLKFPNFRVVNTIGAMNDVIKEIHWRLEATSDDVEPIVVSAYGSSVLADPDPGSFIAYGSVTPANVKAWFDALVDEEGNNLLTVLKAGLDAKIAEKQSPTGYVDDPDQSFLDGVSA